MSVQLNANRVLLIAAAVCFAVALLGALGAFHGVDAQAWGYGGLLALALGLVV